MTYVVCLDDRFGSDCSRLGLGVASGRDVILEARERAEALVVRRGSRRGVDVQPGDGHIRVLVEDQGGPFASRGAQLDDVAVVQDDLLVALPRQDAREGFLLLRAVEDRGRRRRADPRRGLRRRPRHDLRVLLVVVVGVFPRRLLLVAVARREDGGGVEAGHALADHHVLEVHRRLPLLPAPLRLGLLLLLALLLLLGRPRPLVASLGGALGGVRIGGSVAAALVVRRRRRGRGVRRGGGFGRVDVPVLASAPDAVARAQRTRRDRRLHHRLVVRLVLLFGDFALGPRLAARRALGGGPRRGVPRLGRGRRHEAAEEGGPALVLEHAVHFGDGVKGGEPVAFRPAPEAQQSEALHLLVRVAAAALHTSGRLGFLRLGVLHPNPLPLQSFPLVHERAHSLLLQAAVRHAVLAARQAELVHVLGLLAASLFSGGLLVGVLLSIAALAEDLLLGGFGPRVFGHLGRDLERRGEAGRRGILLDSDVGRRLRVASEEEVQGHIIRRVAIFVVFHHGFPLGEFLLGSEQSGRRLGHMFVGSGDFGTLFASVLLLRDMGVVPFYLLNCHSLVEGRFAFRLWFDVVLQAGTGLGLLRFGFARSAFQ